MKYFVLFISVALTSCTTSKVVGDNSRIYNKTKSVAAVVTKSKVKNIIFMIGDGMGLSQTTAGMFMNNNHLELERCPFIGLHKPYSADDLITDSAAGATAFSIGMKTKNKYLGLDSLGNSHSTIAEDASNKGLATGLIVTCSIEHATPAAFYAHQTRRDSFEEIAMDLLKSNINLLIGGGKKYLDNRKNDTLNLINQLKNRGYLVSDTSEHNLENWIFPDVNKLCYFTSAGEPLTYSEGRKFLPIATRKGIEFLNKESTKGFFLMVEGSQIDWGGHDNNANYIISEVLDFDRAIKEALDFAENDKHTLVIITADHETGGFAINSGKKFGELTTAFTTKKHTASLIPVYAFGPGAEQFSGIYENTEIYWKMKRLLEEK